MKTLSHLLTPKGNLGLSKLVKHRCLLANFTWSIGSHQTLKLGRLKKISSKDELAFTERNWVVLSLARNTTETIAKECIYIEREKGWLEMAERAER